MSLQQVLGPGSTGRRVARAAAGLCVIGFGPQAHALGLGEANVASALGQPLQMTVPVMMERDAGLSQDCVRIVPGNPGGDSIASLGSARAWFDSDRSQLSIVSLQPVNEPALRVTVEVGCSERVRREYSLLLDPPGVGAPTLDSNLAASTASSGALGLGMAQISAVLGQRLSVKVPVVGDGASSLTADCVRLSDPISSEGAPVLRQAQIRVLTQSTGTLIEVTTPGPVTEPAVRLALDVGCRDPLRREFAILLGLPALALSNVDATAPDPEPAASQPAPKPAPTRPVKAPVIAAVPVATQVEPKRAASAMPEAQVGKAAAPAGHDRLVLGSVEEGASPAAMAAGIDSSAELLRRMDGMSRQIESLAAQLRASREHELQLERRVSEATSSEGWTWLMGGLGGVLLGGAVTMAWRQRRPLVQPASWEPVVKPAARTVAPSAAPAQARAVAASTEIGGRATMPAAPTGTGLATEPSLSDDRNTHITVTELHDTVQVIKELYATVLERTTSGGTDASTGGGAQPPLELDLRTPTAGSVPTATARLLGDAAGTDVAQPADAAGRRDAGERFTELPTEVGLDLDLGTVTVAAPAIGGNTLMRHFDALAPLQPLEPAAGNAAASSAASTETPAAAAVPGLHDEHLTQTPTELSIDIDVGTATGCPNTIGRPATRVVPFERPDPERTRAGVTPLEPIDLQLDLTQPETRSKRRGSA